MRSVLAVCCLTTVVPVSALVPDNVNASSSQEQARLNALGYKPW